MTRRAKSKNNRSLRDRRRARLTASSTVAESSPRSTRLASLMLQSGVVVSVLALVPLPHICLYSDPKELVVDLIGLTTASLCLVSAKRLTFDFTDLFLSLFLAVSIVSATLAATDRLESLRTVGLTISGAAVLWSSGFLARHGRRQQLLDAVTIAIILVSVTVLIDAFGYGLTYPNASSAGTQGNRNWAAHLIALGMPVLALQSLAGQTARRRAIALGALVVSAAALVLTRSRAGWMAAMLGTALPLVLLTVTSRLSRPVASTARCSVALGALVAGLILSVLIPTQLRWTSPSPYLESAEGLLAYDRGSGQSRLRQYNRSIAMVADHLALGVGPGNWRVIYPSYLPKKGPPGLWYPRRANSDWITLAAERGMPATVLFLAALVSIAAACWKSFLSLVREPSCSERSLEPLFAVAILTTVVIIGSLDAFLQLAAPTLIFFLLMGALAPQQRVIASFNLTWRRRTVLVVVPLLVAATLGMYILDEMYTAFLMARGRGDDLQVASRIAIDKDWFDSESRWFWFKKEIIRRRRELSGHP